MLQTIMDTISWNFQSQSSAGVFSVIPIAKEIIHKAMSGSKSGLNLLKSELAKHPKVNVQATIQVVKSASKSEMKTATDQIEQGLIHLHEALEFQGNLKRTNQSKAMRKSGQYAKFTLNAEESSMITGGGLLSSFISNIVD